MLDSPIGVLSSPWYCHGSPDDQYGLKMPRDNGSLPLIGPLSEMLCTLLGFVTLGGIRRCGGFSAEFLPDFNSFALDSKRSQLRKIFTRPCKHRTKRATIENVLCQESCGSVRLCLAAGEPPCGANRQTLDVSAKSSDRGERVLEPVRQHGCGWRPNCLWVENVTKDTFWESVTVGAGSIVETPR
jgi:hypothetical protein